MRKLSLSIGIKEAIKALGPIALGGRIVSRLGIMSCRDYRLTGDKPTNKRAQLFTRGTSFLCEAL